MLFKQFHLQFYLLEKTSTKVRDLQYKSKFTHAIALDREGKTCKFYTNC